MPFADLTLRAEADGATARVHRGVLATFSPVFEAALRAAPADAREMVLVGKSKAELDLLVAWLYHEHTFSKVRRSAHRERGYIACAPGLYALAKQQRASQLCAPPLLSLLRASDALLPTRKT
jgi:hypothetical protein